MQSYSETIFSTLLERLTGETGHPPSILIVDGMVASGKSTFTNNFKNYLQKQKLHAVILRTDWFITLEENRIPFYLFLVALFISLVFGMNHRLFAKYLSTFMDQEKINRVISKINGLREGRPGANNLSIEIENQIRGVREELCLEPDTFILIEGVFSSVLFPELKNSQTLLISSKTALARRLFIERAKNGPLGWLRIITQSLVQIPPGYMKIFSTRAPEFDYILDVHDLLDPQFRV